MRRGSWAGRPDSIEGIRKCTLILLGFRAQTAWFRCSIRCAALACGDAVDLSAGCEEFVLVGGGGCGGAQDEEVVGCCGDERAVEWGAEFGVEDHAEEGTAAGQAGAVGERGVVGEDGADAGEDGVGGVAKELCVGSGGGVGGRCGR